MASITPHKDGYRVQLKVNSIRESKIFTSKREATAWAERRTLELRAQKKGTLGNIKTLRDAMLKFADEVSPTHKGERWEQIALVALQRALPVTLPISQVTKHHINAWRDSRLQQVSAGTVLREMTLIASVLNHARRDWGWIEHSPIADVRRPPSPRHRDRVITRPETKHMLRALKHQPRQRPRGMTQIAAYAFLIALRTGMRAGEIVGMQWARYSGYSITLPETKNGEKREVPLSPKARALIECLRGLDESDVLPITSASLDALFRKARKQAGLSGFTFHDTRHTAATRIGATVGQPGRLSFPEFCKVFGWKDPKYALVYCNPSAESLASKLV